MEMDREFQGVMIDYKILGDKNLKAIEKFYLALYQRYKNHRVVWIYMKHQLSKGTFLKIQKSLIEKGYIPLDTTQDALLTKNLVLQNKNIGVECEWCGCKTTAIQEHHFPTLKSDGGENVVRICPNCHSEFHLIYKGGAYNDKR